MNYFNKTKKKRVPKLDRPNSSSLEFESLSRSLPLARFHELQRDGESCSAIRRSRGKFRASFASIESFFYSFFSRGCVSHTTQCVCVCVCVAAKGECLLEKDGTGRWFSPGCIDFRYLAGEEFNASLLCNAPSRGTSRAVKLLTGEYDSRISFSYP